MGAIMKDTVNNIYAMVLGHGRFKVKDVAPLWKAFVKVLEDMHPEMAHKEIPLHIKVCEEYSNEA